MTLRPIDPLAEIYPLMDELSLAELADSIRRNGLREPIVLRSNGSVLDGRNRLRACALADVQPRFTEFAGSDEEALQLVIDTNSARRHMTEGEKATVAARLANLRHGGSRTASQGTYTQRRAAERLGISERTVRDAKLILEKGTAELTADVERGLIAVRAAAEMIRAAGKDHLLIAEYHRLRRKSGSVERYTPRHILALVEELLGEINLDPASNAGTPWVHARRHFTQADDGLRQQWSGTVFLNPPWGKQGSPGPWVAKLLEEYASGRVTEAVCLLPARTNTVWMHSLRAHTRCFVRGRLSFGEAEGQAPFPVVLVYLGHRTQDFVNVFDRVGSCYAHVAPRERSPQEVGVGTEDRAAR